MIEDELRKKISSHDAPSLTSTVTDAIASGFEKLGNVTASDFLEKTIPGFVRSSLLKDVLGGAGTAIDSEPTAEKDLDQPNGANSAAYGVLNIGRVASGVSSPFGDADLAQACNR